MVKKKTSQLAEQEHHRIEVLASEIVRNFKTILPVVLQALVSIPNANPAKGQLRQVLTVSLRSQDLAQQILDLSRVSEKNGSSHSCIK